MILTYISHRIWSRGSRNISHKTRCERSREKPKSQQRERSLNGLQQIFDEPDLARCRHGFVSCACAGSHHVPAYAVYLHVLTQVPCARSCQCTGTCHLPARVDVSDASASCFLNFNYPRSATLVLCFIAATLVRCCHPGCCRHFFVAAALVR